MTRDKHYLVVIYKDIDHDVIEDMKHFHYCGPEEPLFYVYNKNLDVRQYRIFKETYINTVEEDA